MTEVERAGRDTYTPPEAYELSMFGTISREQALQIRRDLGAQDRDHRAAWEAERTATGLVWKATYWRYYDPRTDEFFSLDEAVAFLVGGEEAGELSAVSIMLPDGTVLPYEALQRDDD